MISLLPHPPTPRTAWGLQDPIPGAFYVVSTRAVLLTKSVARTRHPAAGVLFPGHFCSSGISDV